MEKANKKSFRLGAVLMLVIVAMLAVFTLTACQQGIQAVGITLDEETVPTVVRVGDTDWIGKVKLLVTVSEEEDAEPVEVYLQRSMLPAEVRNDLNTPGEKSVTVYYQGKTATFEVLVVEEDVEVATVTFYDSENNKIVAKTVVRGESVTPPTAPKVEGQDFVEWVFVSNASSATSALRSVQEDMSVKAKYADNANFHTVTFIGPDGDNRGTVQVLHGNKISLSGIDTSVPSDYDASTVTWTPDINTYVVTNNVTVRMNAQKKTKTVEYCYAFVSKPEVTYSLGISESVVVGSSVTKQTAAQNAITLRGLTFVEWQNTSTNVYTDMKFVAIVADRNFTVSYKNGDHTSETLLAGARYNLPTSAAPKTGYTFNNAWRDDEGNVYTGSVVVNRDLVLEAVYNKKSAPVKLIYNFDLRDPNSGRPIVEERYDNTTLYSDKIDFDYVSEKLEAIKRGNDDYAGFEIERIEYDGSDVTATGVVLGEILGSNPHEFIVTVVNAERGTSDLTIEGGVVKAYTGSATAIFIPEKTPDGTPVTEIESRAFAGRTISRIVIPDSVKKIGEGAFSGAIFGSDVELPALTTLGDGVFMDAGTVLLSGEDEEEVYAEISVTFKSGQGTFTTLPKQTFNGTENIVAVTLPSGVKTIGDEAFCGSNIASIDGLESVESVGDSAFSGAALSTLSLPKLKSIVTAENDGYSFAFAGMEDLTSLSLSTETVYEDGETALSFRLSDILLDGKLTTLTFGKGIKTFVVDTTDVLTIDEESSPIGLYALRTIELSTELASIENVNNLKYLTALRAVNVASGNVKFESDAGVLYTLGEKTILAFYPNAKGGDYTVPALADGLADGFAPGMINTLTLNERIVKAILAGAEPADRAADIHVENVVVAGALLGEGDALVANVNKLRKAFYFAKNLYVNGVLTAEVVEENGWSDVFPVSGSDVSIYNETYALAYEKVYDAEKKASARILFGDISATEIVVPATIDGLRVTEIGAGAFSGYSRLEKLTIQAELKVFGKDALKGATALSEITVASWTEKATVAASAFDDTLWAKSKNLLVLGGKLIKYNNFAADEEKGISTDLVAEDFGGAKEIPDGFFKDMSNLTSVVLPASMEVIGKEAFAKSGVKSIDLADVRKIGDGAFAETSYLTKIEIVNVSEMGEGVFKNSNGLKEALVTATINKGYLPVETFSGCASLTKVTFGEGSLIGLAQDQYGASNAFYGCVALADVDFLATVSEIPDGAFSGCAALRAVDFTKTAVTYIGDLAFSDCTGLEAIVISSKVDQIGALAFGGCSLLKAVRFVANGGLLAPTHEALGADVFPVDSAEVTYTYKIYIASSASATNISSYSARIVRELPKVDFKMYPGYAANGSLGLIDEETIYMDKAPDAPAFDGFVFDAWYYKQNETYKKVEFPYSVVADVTFFARYFNEQAGSIVESDLVLDEEAGTYALVSYENATDDAAYIPAVFDGHPITVVYAGAFADCTNLTELVLPEGVKVIKKGTPADPDAMPLYLKKIVVPSTVTEIEDGAFANMTNLDFEFAEGSKLVNASKAAFEGTKWYLDKKATAEEGGNNGFIIAGHLAIEYLAEGKQIELPSDLYKLADGLFKNNTNIEEIVINNALAYIGDECFLNATNLAYVTYADTTVNNEVDGGNHNSALVYATAESFEGTKWLSGKNKAIIGTIFLKYNGLDGEDAVTIPDYVTVINANAFRGDGTVKEVRFGAQSSLVKIGDYAFAESKLTKVELPAVEEMGVGVYAGCVALRAADLSKVLFDTLPERTFDGDMSLASLTVSDQVTLLGTHSLRGCVALETIVADGIVRTDAFVENGLIDTAFYNVEETEEAQYLVLGKVLVKYIPGTVAAEEEIVAIVPDGVEVILAGVFQYTDIAVVRIPASVRVIEQNAFLYASSLTQVVFDVEEEEVSGLTEIGDMAFAFAGNLSTMVLPVGLEKIGDSAFRNTALTDADIPAAVTTIGKRAFYASKVESVVIGTGVTFIGEEAFGSCANLHKISIDFDSEVMDELNANIEEYVKSRVDVAIELGERTDEYSVQDFETYVEKIFAKATASAKIRTYVDTQLYNYVTNSTDARVRAWRNDIIEIYTKGDYPQVNFDNNDYYMPAFQQEIITELGVPAKTGNTFMGWYLSYVDGRYSDPLVLPYEVYVNTTIYAKWFVNALADDSEGDGLSFRTDGESYVVTAVVPNEETEESGVLYIPSKVGGLPVTGIDLTADVPGVTKVVLTNASAFDGMESNMFAHFPDLKEIELLSDDAEESDMIVEDGVLYNKDKTVLISYLVTYKQPAVEESDEATEEEPAVEETEKEIATEFVVPDTVEEILPNAFRNSGLTKITLSASVTKIGVAAFNASLEEIEFAEGIRLVDADSRSFDNTVWYLGKDGSVPAARTDYVVQGSTVGFFYSAGNMLLRYKQEAQANALVIPNSLNGFDLTVIAGYLYAEARENGSVQDVNFETMTLPNRLEKINSDAFVKINVRVNITTASTVLNDIADDAFTHTTYYKNNNSDMIRLGNVLLKWITTASNITVPEGIVSISNDAFNSSQVQRLVLPSTLKYIGDRAFYNCAGLTSVTLPDSVEVIGKEAFAICQSLTTVVFNVGSSALTEIGEQAFESCRNLTGVELPYRLESLGDRAFENCIHLTKVTFDYFTEENVDNAVVTTLQEKSKMTYLGEGVFENCRELVAISIPNGISAIKAGAFRNCTALKSATFDVDLSKVTVIETEAFAGCSSLGGEINISAPSLVTLVLPNSLVRIAESAFKDCESLFGVRINYNVRYIENAVFSGCANLTKIDVYSSTPASIEASSFNRGDSVYKLRIYVANSPSGNVKANYKREWATYAANIYERNEVPTLYYTAVVEGRTVSSNGIETDIVVGPSWNYNGTNYDNWIFAQFATVADGTTTIDSRASRLETNVSSGNYAVIQGNYVIVILDYDEVRLRATV